MSDIIKSNFISFSEQKRTIKTIDNNDPKILKSTGKKAQVDNQRKNESRVEGLSLSDLNLDPSLGSVHSGDINGVYDQYIEAGDEKYLGHDSQREELPLNEEQQAMLEELQKDAQAAGYEEGFNAGKEEGYMAGYAEGEQALKSEYDKQLSGLEAENQKHLDLLQNQLMDELNGYKANLEPKMLSIIENLVIKLVGQQSISKGTIMHLIKCGLDELEIHGDLIIKVSHEDLDYVIERKAELTEELSEKIRVEILKDQQLSKNECVIETEMGTIESSLGVQLNGLIKELRLIRDSLAENN